MAPINDNWLAAGNTARSMLGLPMVAPYTVGQRWAAALRGGSAMAHADYARQYPFWVSYQESYDAMNDDHKTGAASEERKYGCPAEWHPDYPFTQPWHARQRP